MDKEKIRQYISALKKCEKEHEKDITPTFSIVVSSLCNSLRFFLQDMINQEEDSMDKIIEEFKELGYEKLNEYYCAPKDLYFKHKETGIEINIRLNGFRKYSDGLLLIPEYITPKEMCLINRILRLYGVEV